MATPLIEFRNVTKSFGHKTVLHNISFKIEKQEIFGLIGPSGAGKSTIIKLLTTVISPTSGEILINGTNAYKDLQSLRKIIGFSSQGANFYDSLTAMENLEHFGRLYGVKAKDIKQRSEYLLKLVDLFSAKDKQASKLSGGMQRRLDLALALIHDPQIIVLDEPTAGLDPVLRKQIWSLIKDVQKQGKTVLVSSHELGEIEYVCDEIAIIKDGKILLVETPEIMKKEYSAPTEEIELVTFPGNYKAISYYLEHYKLGKSKIEDNKLLITAPTTKEIISSLVHILDSLQEAVVEINIRKTTLAEVFEALTEGNNVKHVKSFVNEALEKGATKNQVKVELAKKKISRSIIKEVLK